MSSGSLRLFHSARLEPLVAKLGEALASPLADPFAAELVVVPSADMKMRWRWKRACWSFDDGFCRPIIRISAAL